MDTYRSPSIPAVVYTQRMYDQEGAAFVHEPILGYGGVQNFFGLGSSSPPNKRFSLSSRRPLRSSPLAGPALSHSLTMQMTEVDTEGSPVIYSTPPSPSPVTLSPKRSTSSNLVRFSESLLDQPQVHRKSSNTLSASRLPRCSSFHQTYNGNPILSNPPMKPLPALVSPPFSVDEVSPLASRSPLSEQPTASTSTLRPPVTPSSPDSQPTDKTAPLTSTRVLRTPASPPKSQAGFDNWMTANTYTTTPRFSRLGIAAPNVILPIPAREYKRVAGMKKAKLSPGRDLPLKGMRSLESLTTTESTISSSLETLPLSSSSSMAPCGTSLSDVETIVEAEEGNTKVIKVEQSGFSHFHLKRCSSPSSIYSCESMESHVFTGPALETVIEGCSEDGFVIGHRESSRPGSDMDRQGEMHSGVLLKFWKRLAGARRRG